MSEAPLIRAQFADTDPPNSQEATPNDREDAPQAKEIRDFRDQVRSKQTPDACGDRCNAGEDASRHIFRLDIKTFVADPQELLDAEDDDEQIPSLTRRLNLRKDDNAYHSKVSLAYKSHLSAITLAAFANATPHSPSETMWEANVLSTHAAVHRSPAQSESGGSSDDASIDENKTASKNLSEGAKAKIRRQKQKYREKKKLAKSKVAMNPSLEAQDTEAAPDASTDAQAAPSSVTAASAGDIRVTDATQGNEKYAEGKAIEKEQKKNKRARRRARTREEVLQEAREHAAAKAKRAKEARAKAKAEAQVKSQSDGPSRDQGEVGQEIPLNPLQRTETSATSEACSETSVQTVLHDFDTPNAESANRDIDATVRASSSVTPLNISSVIANEGLIENKSDSDTQKSSLETFSNVTGSGVKDTESPGATRGASSQKPASDSTEAHGLQEHMVTEEIACASYESIAASGASQGSDATVKNNLSEDIVADAAKASIVTAHESSAVTGVAERKIASPKLSSPPKPAGTPTSQDENKASEPIPSAPYRGTLSEARPEIQDHPSLEDDVREACLSNTATVDASPIVGSTEGPVPPATAEDEPKAPSAPTVSIPTAPHVSEASVQPSRTSELNAESEAFVPTMIPDTNWSAEDAKPQPPREPYDHLSRSTLSLPVEWRYPKNMGFTCALTRCKIPLDDNVEGTLICKGCSPFSSIRYCSKLHQDEDRASHYSVCGLCDEVAPPYAGNPEWAVQGVLTERQIELCRAGQNYWWEFVKDTIFANSYSYVAWAEGVGVGVGVGE